MKRSLPPSIRKGFAPLAVAMMMVASLAWAQRIKDLPPSSFGVKRPSLSAQAASGERAFDATCAACHGRFGTGTDKGPPLLNPIYNPGHHSDASFWSAVRHGARQHHWRFGDMPPQPQVSDAQLAQIVRYVRELQEANGIRAMPHSM